MTKHEFWINYTRVAEAMCPECRAVHTANTIMTNDENNHVVVAAADYIIGTSRGRLPESWSSKSVTMCAVFGFRTTYGEAVSPSRPPVVATLIISHYAVLLRCRDCLK